MVLRRAEQSLCRNEKLWSALSEKSHAWGAANLGCLAWPAASSCSPCYRWPWKGSELWVSAKSFFVGRGGVDIGHKSLDITVFIPPHSSMRCIYIVDIGHWTLPFSFLNFCTPRCSLFIQWTFGRCTLQFSFLYIPRWVYFYNNKHGGEHQQMQKPNVQCPYVQCIYMHWNVQRAIISRVLMCRAKLCGRHQAACRNIEWVREHFSSAGWMRQH